MLCLYTVLHPLDRLPHQIQNGLCSENLWGLRQRQKPVNKPDLTWNFIFHMPPSDYITFEDDPLLAQNWKWVTHARNCNLFIHHSFFFMKAAQIRTQRISSSLLPIFRAHYCFCESPPTVSFAEMTNHQWFLNHLCRNVPKILISHSRNRRLLFLLFPTRSENITRQTLHLLLPLCFISNTATCLLFKDTDVLFFHF